MQRGYDAFSGINLSPPKPALPVRVIAERMQLVRDEIGQTKGSKHRGSIPNKRTCQAAAISTLEQTSVVT